MCASPRKRTNSNRLVMSALCQKRTLMGSVLSPSEKSGLFLHLISLFLCKLISGGEQCQRFPVAVFAGQCATSAVPNHWERQFATAPTVKKCLARHSR